MRMRQFKKPSEKVNAGILVGKTILKGVAGFFGIDLSKDEKSLQKLYESINLDGKLIVLEDLERCSIDIIELLGFVNNLVEQDGVKVLLVANEDEFIKKYYPGYSITRWLSTYGENIYENGIHPKVLFHLNKNGTFIFNEKTPSWLTDLIKRIINN